MGKDDGAVGRRERLVEANVDLERLERGVATAQVAHGVLDLLLGVQRRSDAATRARHSTWGPPGSRVSVIALSRISRSVRTRAPRFILNIQNRKICDECIRVSFPSKIATRKRSQHSDTLTACSQHTATEENGRKRHKTVQNRAGGKPASSDPASYRAGCVHMRTATPGSRQRSSKTDDRSEHKCAARCAVKVKPDRRNGRSIRSRQRRSQA